MANKKLVKKSTGGEPIKDSTKYYKDLYNANVTVGASQKDPKKMDKYINRQSRKGKPGYDANVFPLKKMGGAVKTKSKK